jgi:hypothetical protein
VICIALSLAICLIGRVPLTVREGTVIGMLIFAPSMNVFMKWEKKWFEKLDLI